MKIKLKFKITPQNSATNAHIRHCETKRSFVAAIHKFMSAKFKALMNLKNRAANALNLRNLKSNLFNFLSLNALNSINNAEYALNFTQAAQIKQTTQIQIPQRANNGI